MTPLQQMIEREEGRCYAAYLDTLGIPTIGVGHTGPEVHMGLTWTDAQVSLALAQDIQKAVQGVKHALPWLDDLNDARQAVLVSMAFQLGIRGLQGFPHMLTACRNRDFAEAADQMRDSKWAKQTPKRVARAAWMMVSGEWWAPGFMDAPP